MPGAEIGKKPEPLGKILAGYRRVSATVILCQFWMTRRVKIHTPMLMIALGSAFFLFGMSGYAFITQYALFLAAAGSFWFHRIVLCRLACATGNKKV